MKKIFEFKGKLPEGKQSVSIYRTSRPWETQEKLLEKRMRTLPKIFGIKPKSEDHGEIIRLREKSRILDIYPASDSFIYFDEELFGNEDIKFSKTLPDERTAKESAISYLKNNSLLNDNASFSSITYSTVAINKGTKPGRAVEYKTEIHANFNYSIEKLPVFGPGAKSRVSFVNKETFSNLYHFWRETEDIKEKRNLMDPEFSLELFSKNFRFAKLKEDAAKVVIKKMELGYFAMSPSTLQNYLLPVYRFQGTISTREFPKYDFELHQVAMKYSEEDVKKMGVRINDVKSIIF